MCWVDGRPAIHLPSRVFTLIFYLGMLTVFLSVVLGRSFREGWVGEERFGRVERWSGVSGWRGNGRKVRDGVQQGKKMGCGRWMERWGGEMRWWTGKESLCTVCWRELGWKRWDGETGWINEMDSEIVEVVSWRWETEWRWRGWRSVPDRWSRWKGWVKWKMQVLVEV